MFPQKAPKVSLGFPYGGRAARARAAQVGAKIGNPYVSLKGSESEPCVFGRRASRDTHTCFFLVGGTGPLDGDAEVDVLLELWSLGLMRA